MTEIWKDIKGFEGCYQISNLGRVKSLARWVNHGYNGGWWKKETIRTPGKTRGGYLFIPLTVDGVTTGKRINRLVAEAFISNYTEDAEVHHKDGNKANNKAENLECLSSKDHRLKHPPMPVVGEKDGCEIFFDSAKDTEQSGFSPADVSRCCKCSLLPVGHPKRKRYATHKGYTWRYGRRPSSEKVQTEG